MAIERRWINWATSICGAILLVFSLAQVVVAFYLNLTALVNSGEKLAISGALLVSLGVLIFPTCWIAFCSAISRHRGVYIAYMVMVCLSILDSIGMLVYQAYRFAVLGGYRDVDQGVAITMTILQSLIIVILFFALAFGAAALCYQCPDHSYDRKPKYGGAYPGLAGAPPTYTRDFGPSGYTMSLPRQAGYEYGQYATEPRLYYSKGGRY